jgi:hypothetical protein
MKVNLGETYFVPSRHKYGLSRYPTWNIMEKNITFCIRIKPDWDKLPHSEDVGVVMKNGKHAGIQLSHEKGDGYVKGLLWVTQDNTDIVEPIMLVHGLGPITEDKTFDIMWQHDVDNKEISLTVAEPGWTQPFTERLKYEGNIMDYSDSWLWVGCNNAQENCPKVDRGYYSGELDRVGIFGSSLTEKDFVLYFDDETNLENLPFENQIVVCDFKKHTLYKYFDLTGNGNNIIVYQPEWGELF